MKLLVCTKCGKAKKKKVEGETRMSGQEIFDDLSVWIAKAGVASRLELQAVRCLDECKKEPTALLKSQKKLYKRLTREKLEELKLDLLKGAIDES